MRTLAAELLVRAAHMDTVRAEYDRTVVAHAQKHGCGHCVRAFHEDRSIGWDYLPDGTPELCPNCAFERRRWAAQMAAEAKKPKVCANGHALVEGNLYRNVGPSGNVVRRCRECVRIRSKAWRKVNGR